MSKAIDAAAGAEREVVGRAITGAAYTRGDRRNADEGFEGGQTIRTLTAPATPDAQRWQGFGTAVAPAHEPIVCGTTKDVPASANGTTGAHGIYREGWGKLDERSGMNPNVGRWPKNVVLVHNDTCRAIGERRVTNRSGDIDPSVGPRRNDVYGKDSRPRDWKAYGDPDGTETITAWDCTPGCPIAAMDAQSGDLHGAGFAQPRQEKWAKPEGYEGWGNVSKDGAGARYGDSGGASRFFFQSKASTAQRNAMDLSLLPRARSARKRYQQDAANRWAPRVRNWHSTVKPLELMRWLVRLVGGQPGSTILDPFAGSGTTGIACVLEGFRFIGIEKSAEYVPLARARIAWWAEHPEGVEVDAALQADRQRKRVAEGGQLRFTFDDGAAAA